MDDGYEKGQSDNIPKIDGLMIALYFAKYRDFVEAEMRGVKMKESARDNFGDDTVGYVQMKRTGNTYTVKCRITPEHRVRTKPYHCSLVCDENEEEILNLTCVDCATSKGGCKHAVALLIRLHRRSEEPLAASAMCEKNRSSPVSALH
ncbi:hypothetical protein HHI36_002194 [Cryptolaemus montrouzieri]|uniref:SWIM-type domain-containing protein n=1 Tax=Cryptolaemus montrouzieri TaxID=559131 RepID=A0ABD2PA17_9CUCU